MTEPVSPLAVLSVKLPCVLPEAIVTVEGVLPLMIDSLVSVTLTFTVNPDEGALLLDVTVKLMLLPATTEFWPEVIFTVGRHEGFVMLVLAQRPQEAE